MPPKSITAEQFDELKKQVNGLTETVNKIQNEFIKNLTLLSGSVKNIETMMKQGFGDGKEQCYTHRQNILEKIDRLDKTQKEQGEEIDSIKQKNAASQVWIAIIAAVVTSGLTALVVKLITK
ncbi:MAG: hypothetical protein C4574_00600 [Candidatus Latescibacterota bacterium]|jgi:ABC-type transporter Mla subunit MlaD|nr:MAG: hypothetical protein C4574_00600 [Candidatus Latescibacterota bacterium]